MSPSRAARVTASVRYWAPSFDRIAFRWNLTLFSLTLSETAIALFSKPPQRVHFARCQGTEWLDALVTP